MLLHLTLNQKFLLEAENVLLLLVDNSESQNSQGLNSLLRSRNSSKTSGKTGAELHLDPSASLSQCAMPWAAQDNDDRGWTFNCVFTFGKHFSFQIPCCLAPALHPDSRTFINRREAGGGLAICHAERLGHFLLVRHSQAYFPGILKQREKQIYHWCKQKNRLQSKYFAFQMTLLEHWLSLERKKKTSELSITET